MAAHNLTSIVKQHLLLFIIDVKLHHMVQWYNPSPRDFLRFAAEYTPSLPVMNPEESQSLFAAWLDVFEPISGQPNDTDLTWLHKELTSILIPFLYDVENGIHNLMGLVLDEDNYKLRYHNKFPKPTKPAIYDEAISNNATKVVRAKAEAVHINTLKDEQKQSNRAGNPITAETLLLISSNAMLVLERFPRADESLEDLTKNEKDWSAWKICTRHMAARPR